MRLRRVSPAEPGWSRRRCGRGFRFVDEHGRSLPADDVERCRRLAIPPAWVDVWICASANGHLQAVGTDEAGRRQYLYHPDWRTRRDRLKHDRVLDVGRRLPRARREARRRLRSRSMTRERALATAFLLLDLGLFRIGGEEYTEENGSFGLATVEKRHVHVAGDTMTFDYPAKSGQRRIVEVTDAAVGRSVQQLLRRRGGGPQLLAYREGGQWRDVTSHDIATCVKELLGADATSKDFRTWHATVTAAELLAGDTGGTPPKRAVRRTAEAVAEVLGDTPAVVRRSYIDPRVVDRFEAGDTIAARDGTPPRTREARERSVLRLVGEASGRDAPAKGRP